MCTLLAGADSKFLPFNRGHDFGAGNPPNRMARPPPICGRGLWQRDSWLEILGRYLVALKDDRKRLLRWSSLASTSSMSRASWWRRCWQMGGRGKYLVEHSAGSGKTNSIAWTAHFLADLHDAESRKVFDTVLVVSDAPCWTSSCVRRSRGSSARPAWWL